MSNLLLLTSSPRGEASFSTTVGRALIERLRAAAPGATVTERDLARSPLAHIGGDFLAGEQAAIAQSDALIAELFAADTIVIASAMINFGVASTLKSWFDNVLRAGKTFAYSEKGPEGLVKNKKAYLVVARGGVYSDGPMKALDFQEPYIKSALGFIGITDVEVVAVEGVAFGPEAAEKAVAGALGAVDAITLKAA